MARAGDVADRCWWAAVVMFNDELTRDKKKRIDINNVAQSHPYSNLARLLQQTKDLHRSRLTGRGSLREGLDRALQAANNHAVVGDVFIQGQSEVAAFAWGSIRLLLRVATSDIDTLQELGSALIHISDQVGHWEEQLRLFAANQRIFHSVKKLFAHVLHYLVKATLHLPAVYVVRAARAAFGGNIKFRTIFALIENCASSLDSEFSTASEIRARRVQRLEPILSWLQSDSSYHTSQPDQAEPGTCSWFEADPATQAWQQSGFPGCLWVQGITGCGKSVLAGYIAKSAETDLVISHYFRESSSVTTSQALSFALSVLVFLCTKSTISEDPLFEGVTHHLLQLLPAASARARHDLDQLLECIDLIFDKLPNFTLVVDALDECRGRKSRQLFQYLWTLGQKPHVRVVLLSREHSIAEEVFQGAKIVKMDRHKIEPDIRRYVKARIGRTESLQPISNDILEKVSTSCQGMFLWVRFMLDNLENADTLNEQLEALNQFPADLFDAFDRLLAQNSCDFTAKQNKTCHEIFLLIVGAKRLFSVEEISTLIALDTQANVVDKGNLFVKPVDTLRKMCGPFIRIVDGRVELVHTAVKEWLLQRKIDIDYSNAYLADKCLSKLSEEKYCSLQYAAALLREHLLPSGLVRVKSKTGPRDPEPLPYEYAALHWQDHLTKVFQPSDALLAKFANFIGGNAAVTWSERLVDLKGGGETVNIGLEVAVLAELTAWANTLPPQARKRAPVEDFFVLAHERIRTALLADGKDTLLPYVPAIRLGQFFNIGGKSYAEFQKSYDYKKIVVDGFTKVLGERNPLTLKYRTKFINEYFWQGRTDEAEKELKEVASIEAEVLRRNSLEYLETLTLLGSAQCFLNNYEDACRTFARAGEGLLETVGSNSPSYLMNLLFYGQAIERQANLPEARRMWEEIWMTWTPIHGKAAPLALMAQTAVSSIYRKQGAYELAKENLQHAWNSRLRLFTLNSNTTIDSGILLALTYREMSLYDEAVELLDHISKSTVLETNFERQCQIAHIRALIAFDHGAFEEPRLALTRLIDSTIGQDRDRNNRECLWLRTALADVLRQHGEDSEALMLFSELVKPAEDSNSSRPNTPGLADEPESPAQLAIAEQALRLVKSADPAGADELLAKHDLRWLRNKDFWIIQGGPITDTAWTKPIQATQVEPCIEM